MEKTRTVIDSFFIALYAWIVSVFFGAVLMDTVYARLIPLASGAFSPISDLLLPVGLLAILVSIGAIAVSWRSSAARGWFATSLVVLLFEFLVPVIFPTLRNSPGTEFLALLRIAINGAASVIAFVGLVVFLRGK